MNKRGIYALFFVVVLLGCFFQYTRLDGFLHLNPAANKFRRIENLPVQVDWSQVENLPVENYIVIYDPTSVRSMFCRHNAERTLQAKKKHFESVDLRQSMAIPQDTQGVVVTTGRLGAVAALPQILQYVQQGGTLVVLQQLELEGDKPLAPETLRQLGITGLKGNGKPQSVTGLSMRTNFLIGAKGEEIVTGRSYNTYVLPVELGPEAVVHITDRSGSVPLVWQEPLGQGEMYFYNGVEREDKSNRGILMAMLAHCGTDTLYPVVGVKIFFIDDFPAPVPEGYYDKIYQETGLSTSDFYRKAWWPFMKQLAQREKIKFTGVIIESYNDRVHPPFEPQNGRNARDALVVYGHDLLNMGGEMGLHGYNHQPLVPPGYQDHEPDYVPWTSEEDIQAALTELRRYVYQAYPEYSFEVYVPPSNILSPMGKDALKKVFPELKIFASLYDGPADEHAYYQNFRRERGGYYDIPRISSGYVPDQSAVYGEISAINDLGVFNHFIHPDEMFYEESAKLSWKQMHDSLENFVRELSQRYPWLKAVTVSESLPYFDTYYDLDYRMERSPEMLVLHCRNYIRSARFLLRSQRTLDHVQGCRVNKVEDGVYFVEVTDPVARIYWKN